MQSQKLKECVGQNIFSLKFLVWEWHTCLHDNGWTQSHTREGILQLDSGAAPQKEHLCLFVPFTPSGSLRQITLTILHVHTWNSDMGIPEYSLFVSYKIYTGLIELCLSVCLAIIHPLRQIQRIFLGLAHGVLGKAIFSATVKWTRINYCQWLPVCSTRFEVSVAIPKIVSSSLFSSLSHLFTTLSLCLYIHMLKTSELNRIVGRYHI